MFDLARHEHVDQQILGHRRCWLMNPATCRGRPFWPAEREPAIDQLLQRLRASFLAGCRSRSILARQLAVEVGRSDFFVIHDGDGLAPAFFWQEDAMNAIDDRQNNPPTH